MVELRTDQGGGDKDPAGNQPSAWAAFLTAHAVLVGRVEDRLRTAGLPELSWYDVLWALERAPEQRLRMHELSAATVISRSNLTRLVDRLQTAGLVERNRDCSDRRGAYAVLTMPGRARRRAMWKVYGKAIEDFFDGQLTSEENAMLRDLLTRLLMAGRAADSG